eukprot:CAMPEP_0184650910 /NCGR_PEP_ID=MMETSP0308-20130426/8480_1 /TAXON_ID=38269 /ORGANISM="Gloeochaete witrockiana, Strain SAG 46.84" /LENGTH=65 /DNA_ID=CAMNT_0027084769 /DNA_START=50 /DNA_END=247 /DNA_ORIENTATION=-
MSSGGKLNRLVYDTVFKRNTTYMLFILAGAVVGEYAVNKVGDSFWEKQNEGKLWKHLESKLKKDE